MPTASASSVAAPGPDGTGVGRRRALARAVAEAARERALPLSPARDFDSTPGVGVTATAGGRRVTAGPPARLPAADDVRDVGVGDASTGSSGVGDVTVVEADRHQGGRVVADDFRAEQASGTRGRQIGGATDAVAAHAAVHAPDLEEFGRTAALGVADCVPVGLRGLADRLRLDAAATVASLTHLTGAAPTLLTGDNPRAAACLAAQVGIDDVRAGLLPQRKVGAVTEMEPAGRKVLVVGGGVNDAPALAAAHTGVAMGRAGTDLALETADTVVVRDELATVPAVIAFSRRARASGRADLVTAGGFIAGLVVRDLAGIPPLPLGVAGHEGSTVLVGLNGLRLLGSGLGGGGRRGRLTSAVENRWISTAVLPYRAADPSRPGEDVPLYTV